MAKANEIAELNCEADIIDGIRLVLKTRLMEMCALGKKAIDWSDIEGVHDMRVASRRLRSALRDFAPFIRKRDIRHLAQGIKEIASTLGFVRDEDVAIDALEKLSADAPDDVKPGVNLLIDERRVKRDASRAVLLAAISADALARVQKDWSVALENLSAGACWQKSFTHQNGSHEMPSFRRAGSIVIAERWKEMAALSESLSRPFETEPLHDMRIAAKRLRYALELFAQCWGDELTSYAKEIAAMQSSLGELHDCDVWLEWLGENLRAGWNTKGQLDQQEDSNSERERKQRAVVWLMVYFMKERTKHYNAALARWYRWETSGFAKSLLEHLQAEISSAATAVAQKTQEEQESDAAVMA